MELVSYSYLLNLSKQLHEKQFIKENTTKMKNTVSTASGAQTGDVYFFKHAQR
jgi:hypothetical protein